MRWDNSKLLARGAQHAGFKKRAAELIEYLPNILEHLYPELSPYDILKVSGAAFSQGCPILEGFLAEMQLRYPHFDIHMVQNSPPPSYDKDRALWLILLFGVGKIIHCTPYTEDSGSKDIVTMAPLLPWWGGKYYPHHIESNYALPGSCFSIHNAVQQVQMIRSSEFETRVSIQYVEAERNKSPFPILNHTTLEDLEQHIQESQKPHTPSYRQLTFQRDALHTPRIQHIWPRHSMGSAMRVLTRPLF